MSLEQTADCGPETLVSVRRQWNDYRTATVRLDHLRHFHWREESGGVRARSPRPFLHARMWCDAIVAGELAHSCAHGEGPHEILVCIVKKDNLKSVFSQLERLADEE
jgi:hypothetical protein